MKLEHTTEIAAPPEEVWEFLQDTRGVVACLPGAELVEDLGDDRFAGVLRVAIGPLKMNYAGQVEVTERSSADHLLVLDAGGRDKRGAGSVQAHIRLKVEPSGQASRIAVVSDVDLSGRIASLGRGVRDVSNRMFVDFAGQLGARVEQGPQAEAAQPSIPVPTGATEQTDVTRTSANGAGSYLPPSSHAPAGEIKVLPLVWTVSRERLAAFLERLSQRVRP